MKRTSGIIFFLFTLTVIAAAQSTVSTPLKPKFKNGLWGYVDANGRMIIAPQFDAAGPFSDGLARVGMVKEETPELNGVANIRWGFIDEQGKVIVPMRYAELRPFAGELAAAAIRLDGVRTGPIRDGDDPSLRWGFVNRKGEVQIALQFLAAGDFAEGLAPVNVLKAAGDEAEAEHSLCSGPLNFGYIDTAGKIVIEPQFAIAGSFANGRARVGKGGFDYLGRCLCCNPRFAGIYGYIDRRGTFTADANSQPF